MGKGLVSVEAEVYVGTQSSWKGGSVLFWNKFLLSKYHVDGFMPGTVRTKRACLVPAPEELTMSLEMTHSLSEPDCVPGTVLKALQCPNSFNFHNYLLQWLQGRHNGHYYHSKNEDTEAERLNDRPYVPARGGQT